MSETKLELKTEKLRDSFSKEIIHVQGPYSHPITSIFETDLLGRYIIKTRIAVCRVLDEFGTVEEQLKIMKMMNFDAKESGKVVK